MTNKRKQQDKLWVACPTGAIQNVADSSTVTLSVSPAMNLQRRKFLIGAATAAGVTVLGGVSYLAIRGPGQENGPVPRPTGVAAHEYEYGGIKCSEVLVKLPAYIGETIGEQETSEKIKQHLDMCENCRDIYEAKLKS